MVRRILVSAVCGMAMLAAAPALAQTPTAQPDRRPAGINHRQQLQARRIRTAREQGLLTPVQLRRLVAQQRAIRLEERRYRASGGGLSPREFRDLQRDLTRASRTIRRYTGK